MNRKSDAAWKTLLTLMPFWNCIGHLNQILVWQFLEVYSEKEPISRHQFNVQLRSRCNRGSGCSWTQYEPSLCERGRKIVCETREPSDSGGSINASQWWRCKVTRCQFCQLHQLRYNYIRIPSVVRLLVWVFSAGTASLIALGPYN